MGVTLEYRSSFVVPSEKARRFLAAAEEFAQSRDWWSEPIWFSPIEERPKSWLTPLNNLIDRFLEIEGEPLSGFNKFSIPGGYTGDHGDFVEVDAFENELMGYLDCVAIVTFLAQWAPYCGCGWYISCIGEECGLITSRGEIEPKLTEFLDSFWKQGQFDPAEAHAK